MLNQMFHKLKAELKKKKQLNGRSLLKLLNKPFAAANQIKEIKIQKVKTKVHKKMF